MRTTDQVAEDLGITPSRVRALIAAGTLPAERLGRIWVVHERDLAVFADRDRRAGPRSMSPRIAWACAAILDGQEVDWLDSSELGRLRRRLERPASVGVWQARMARRAAGVHVAWLSKDLHQDVLDEPCVSAWNAADAVPADEVVRGGRLTVWVEAGDLIPLINRYALIEASVPNVVLRTFPDCGLRFRGGGVPTLIAAADLMDEPDARSRALGARVLSRALGGVERR